MITDLTTGAFRLDRPADILELVGSGARDAILLDTQIDPAFFDLSTGFAGEVVQKCMNYGLRVAIVLTLSAERSRSFREFAAESTRQGRFLFVETLDAARAALA